MYTAKLHYIEPQKTDVNGSIFSKFKILMFCCSTQPLLQSLRQNHVIIIFVYFLFMRYIEINA